MQNAYKWIFQRYLGWLTVNIYRQITEYIHLNTSFSESLSTDSGEEVSTREVKQILLDAVSNEDKSAPLPDEKLMEILNQKGYNIARRTIAKYREQLNIPVARLRKEL